MSLFMPACCDDNPFFLPRHLQAALSASGPKRILAAQALLRGTMKSLRTWGLVTGNFNQELAKLLKDTHDRVESSDSINSLRGVEGNLRKEIFAIWRRRLDPAWGFTKRNRRPPEDPVNALISYGNSIVYRLCLPPILRAGLHPALGIMHEERSGRDSLSLDLAEIFKPLIVDIPIWKIIQKERFSPDMATRNNGACMLNAQGRKCLRQAMVKEAFKLFGESGEENGWPLSLTAALDSTAGQMKRLFLDPMGIEVLGPSGI
jgi:CRISPR-associated protein Cas1